MNLKNPIIITTLLASIGLTAVVQVITKATDKRTNSSTSIVALENKMRTYWQIYIDASKISTKESLLYETASKLEEEYDRLIAINKQTVADRKNILRRLEDLFPTQQWRQEISDNLSGDPVIQDLYKELFPNLSPIIRNDPTAMMCPDSTRWSDLEGHLVNIGPPQLSQGLLRYSDPIIVARGNAEQIKRQIDRIVSERYPNDTNRAKEAAIKAKKVIGYLECVQLRKRNEQDKVNRYIEEYALLTTTTLWFDNKWNRTCIVPKLSLKLDSQWYIYVPDSFYEGFKREVLNGK